jgi:hypothetical protein
VSALCRRRQETGVQRSSSVVLGQKLQRCVVDAGGAGRGVEDEGWLWTVRCVRGSLLDGEQLLLATRGGFMAGLGSREEGGLEGRPRGGAYPDGGFTCRHFGVGTAMVLAQWMGWQRVSEGVERFSRGVLFRPPGADWSVDRPIKLPYRVTS